jgi:Polyketide cyclase / dehydrase and lipid transport
LRGRNKGKEKMMYTIDVGIHINAPIGRVWDQFADYEGYTDIREVSSAKLLQEGNDERTGVGAVREVRIKGVTFVEDIVTFDAPKCLEYRVKKSSLPMKHEIGRMEFSPSGEGTDVHWTSRFELAVPLIGKMLERFLGASMSKTFTSCLEQAKLKLESQV